MTTAKFLILSIILCFLSACAMPQSNTGQGTMYGAGIGAVTGALIGQLAGKNTESTLIGAGIGAVAGAGAGAAWGSYLDKQEAQFRQKLADSNVVDIDRVSEDVLRLRFKSDEMFTVGESTLKSPATLDALKVSQVLTEFEDSQIIIEGHTDSTGDATSNLKLSSRRADALERVMLQKGVALQRIKKTAAGEAAPMASNTSRSGRSKNRRVEVYITPPA